MNVLPSSSTQDVRYGVDRGSGDLSIPGGRASLRGLSGHAHRAPSAKNREGTSPSKAPQQAMRRQNERDER